MADWERAMNSYEAALRHNPYSIAALSHIASLCRGREQFAKVIYIFRSVKNNFSLHFKIKLITNLGNMILFNRQ